MPTGPKWAACRKVYNNIFFNMIEYLHKQIVTPEETALDAQHMEARSEQVEWQSCLVEKWFEPRLGRISWWNLIFCQKKVGEGLWWMAEVLVALVNVVFWLRRWCLFRLLKSTTTLFRNRFLTWMHWFHQGILFVACPVLVQTSIFRNKWLLWGRIYDIGLANLYLCTVLRYFVFQSEEVCYIEVAMAEVRVRE